MNRVLNRSADVRGAKVLLFKSNNISIYFYTSFYKQIKDKESQKSRYEYHHTEYLYMSERSISDISISLSPNSYIIFQTYDRDGQRHSFLMNQTERSTFIRMAGRLVNLLEQHNSGEIVGLVYEGKLNQNLLNAVIPMSLYAYSDTSSVNQLYGNVKNGTMILGYLVKLNGVDGNFNVSVNINNKVIIDLKSTDFCNMYHSLREANFPQLTMSIVNYVGSPEIGEHRVDMRKGSVKDIGFDDNEADRYANMNVVRQSGIEGLETTNVISNISNKRKW